MEKEFVPYELALKLKELGFNEECLGRYTKGWIGDGALKFYTGCGYKNDIPDYPTNCVAPLWQQAFDWFRNKGFNVVIYKVEGEFWDWDIQDDNIDEDEIYDIDLFQTHEQARLECLKQLIKIIE